MPPLAAVLEKVDEYASTYRGSSLPDLEISGLYDLFPKDGVEPPADIAWPDPYEHGDRAGVYLVLTEDLAVGYIGMSKRIGVRLSDYFVYEKAGEGCFLRHSDSWVMKPRYIFTIAVPEESPFEAYSLEQFLIREFKSELTDNK